MSVAGDVIRAAAGKTVNGARRPCRLSVHNKAGDLVRAVTADSFMEFKGTCDQNTAVIVELACGEAVFVESCKHFKRLPCGAAYRARLLQRTSAIPAELAKEAIGRQVRVDAGYSLVASSAAIPLVRCQLSASAASAAPGHAGGSAHAHAHP